MICIKTDLVKEVVYNLCLQAGQELSPYPYGIFSNGYKKHPLPDWHTYYKMQKMQTG